jgi:hypothetical protein
MAPARYVEYDWVSNTWLSVPDDLVSSSSSQCPNGTFMLPLPNGQILVSNNGGMELFTSTGTPDPSWLPIVESTSATALSPGATFSVSGKQLSGLTQGQQWGDEWEAATNYPIVQIENKTTHNISYARSFDITSTSIAPNSASTFNFVLDQSVQNGTSWLRVVASGFASAPVDVTISGGLAFSEEKTVVPSESAAEKAAAELTNAWARSYLEFRGLRTNIGSVFVTFNDYFLLHPDSKVSLQRVFDYSVPKNPSQADLNSLESLLQGSAGKPSLSSDLNTVMVDITASAAQHPKVLSKVTISCLKGQLVKKVTAANPTCPVGYKKK